MINLALLCYKCTGACCKSNKPGAVLLDGEEAKFYESIVIHDALLGNVNFIPNRDGRCVYLGSDDRCTIYDRRPRLCREFDCTSGYPERIGFFLGDHPDVLQLIKDHSVKHETQSA